MFVSPCCSSLRRVLHYEQCTQRIETVASSLVDVSLYRVLCRKQRVRGPCYFWMTGWECSSLQSQLHHYMVSAMLIVLQCKEAVSCEGEVVVPQSLLITCITVYIYVVLTPVGGLQCRMVNGLSNHLQHHSRKKDAMVTIGWGNTVQNRNRGMATDVWVRERRCMVVVAELYKAETVNGWRYKTQKKATWARRLVIVVIVAAAVVENCSYSVKLKKSYCWLGFNVWDLYLLIAQDSEVC